MSARDLFRLDLPGDEPPEAGEVVPFPNAAPLPALQEGDLVPARPGLVERVQPSVERFATGWRAAWVGDGLLGMRPRPVADLIRQFWTDPKPYIKDALVLRIPYAIYGVPVIAVSAVTHLLLLIISYPSLLAGTGLLVLFLSLFL
ncbi:hypothetical protein [Nonomuraea bangladeshensis]|uniref:hypothetical protein n=1 Tax=Nonomuraea bangladeshensis TaxID=404385 RepID=UPI003C2E87B1